MNIYYITVIKDQEPRHTLAGYLWLKVYHESSRWLGCRTISIWRLGCVCTRALLPSSLMWQWASLSPHHMSFSTGLLTAGYSFVFRFSISFFPPIAFFRYTIQWFVAYSELCHQTCIIEKKSIIHYQSNPPCSPTPTPALGKHQPTFWLFIFVPAGHFM